MAKMVLTLACAATLLLACAEAPAAVQGGPAPGAPLPPAAKPKAAEGERAKTEDGEAAKPQEGPPSAEAEGAQTPAAAANDSGPVSLAELTRDGFEIRATDFIPAEAVTRQSGKVTSDAVVVTLQKTSSTAICFYTLKAYVGKKLTMIPACNVHR